MSNWTNIPPSGLFPPGITVGGGGSLSQKIPSMPETCKDIPLKDLLDAATAAQHSRVRWPVENMEQLTRSNEPLTDWEIKQVEEAFNRFFVKYKSPLAKAMK
jgi:hypothetical protein